MPCLARNGTNLRDHFADCTWLPAFDVPRAFRRPAQRDSLLRRLLVREAAAGQ